MKLTAIIQAVIICIALWLASCREPIVYVNDIEYVFEVCDTISTKYNHPDVGDVTYTIRCTDQFGNERTYLIINRP